MCRPLSVGATYHGQQATAGTAGDRAVEQLEARRQEATQSTPKVGDLTKEIQLEKGRRVHAQTCFACRQGEGQGPPGVFPPLANADYLMPDKSRSITAIIKGLAGPIVVNGKTYNGVMPPALLTDEQIANVLTYVRNALGMKATPSRSKT